MLGKSRAFIRIRQMRILSHDKDFTLLIDRACFDEHYTETRSGRTVEIAYARLLCP
jgi:hypothetical protein